VRISLVLGGWIAKQLPRGDAVGPAVAELLAR
jgi:hypothetical protein